MFSKILTKLIDEAIVPAVVVLTTRVVSVVLLCKHFNIVYAIDASGFSFADKGDYLLINSYSTLAIIVVMSVGIFYTLIKSYIFHEQTISPSITAKLFTLRISSFIQSSMDVYSQGTIWLSYNYLITIITGIMAFFGSLYWWVFVTSAVLTIIATVLLVIDVEEKLSVRQI